MIFDVLVTLLLMLSVALVGGSLFFALLIAWECFRDSELCPTAFARRPRSMATRMTDHELAMKWQRYEWERRKRLRMNQEQSASQH
jgi:hypothetical protein